MIQLTSVKAYKYEIIDEGEVCGYINIFGELWGAHLYEEVYRSSLMREIADKLDELNGVSK